MLTVKEQCADVMQKQNNTIQKNTIPAQKTLLVLLLLLVAAFFTALAIGRFHVPVKESASILLSRIIPLNVTWTEQMENVILSIRLPRVIGAVLVGSALAISGASYQGMFRNPLVSPDLLGVSAGACVGAASAILMHLGTFAIQLFALIGGLAAVLITVTIPKLFKNKSSLMLVLAGVIVSGFMNALMGTLKYIADPENELAAIVYWTMGSLASVKTRDILAIAPAMIAATVVLLLLRWRINLLALGDAEAYSLGVNVKNMRRCVIFCSTVLTASAICLSGTIGWIGLVVPHLGRLLVGQDNKNLMPASALLGAVFMVTIDTLARNMTGSEIPLSILTGLLGTPLFIWLLSRQKARIQ